MGKLTSTHTYAELELSPVAYEEIKAKLKEAGYDHAFMEDGAIDMHGIGVTREGGPVKYVGTHCSICGSSQFETPSGLSCIHGHASAERQ